MKLPAWLLPTHPILRREVRPWQRHIRQLWLTFLILPFTCTACLWSPFFYPDSYRTWTDAASGLFMTLWAWEGFLGLWLGIVVTTRSITLIARERENSSWSLLKLTPFNPADIVRAKIGAVIYWLRWPIAWLWTLRVVCVLLTVAPAALTAPAFTPAEAGLAVLFLLLFCAELPVSVAYNCLVGLFASAMARTTAAANAIVYPLHVGLFLMIFMPLWYEFVRQLFTAGAVLGRGETLAVGVSFFALLIPTQAILGTILFRVATTRAERLVD